MRRIVLSCLVAVLLSLVTLWLRLNLPVAFGQRPSLILFMFPILLSAMLGGFIPGLLATLVSAACSAYFLIQPIGSFSIAAEADRLQWGMMIASGFLASALSLALHRSRRREIDRWHELDDSESRLQQIEWRFQVTFERAGVGIAHVALDGHWLKVNDALCRALGYGADELLAMSFQQLTHPDDLQDNLAQLPQLLSGEIQTFRREKRYLRKDGSTVWAELTASLVRDAQSRPEYFIAVIEDISERKRIEAELDRHRHRLEEMVAERTQQLDAVNASLAQQRRLLNTVADSLPGLVGYWGADLRCRFANASYEPWFGRPQQEFVGIHIRELLGPELFTRNEPLMQAALRGQWQRFQRSVVERDGHTRHTLINYVPHAVEGRVLGFVAVVTDVSELKEAEVKLTALNEELALRVDQAEAATRAKSSFLANMSHEIRTPMNAIIGLTHLVMRDTTDTAQHGRLARIDNAARHLLQVINDILDLSKIEAGKTALEDVEFALDEMLARSFDMVSERAGEKGLDLLRDTDGLPKGLRGDPTRLSQALINLLSNAVKFTESGWVRLRAEILAEEGQRVLLRFEVQDTGPGVPLERQPMLFHAFEQVDGSATRRHGGTGLGLALTRHLASMMGGEVGMSSAPGEGSCFWFSAWLGRAPGGPASSPAKGESLARLRSGHAGQRILLAEDNPVNRELAVELLQSAGLVVETAEDGALAVELVASRHYDLILMDVQMPVMDGLAATRIIRERSGSDMPIVAMTAGAFAEDRAACLEAGMNAHLAKPADPEQLYAMLLRWLPPVDEG